MSAPAYAPPASPPDIVFADDALVVLVKPSGLLSVPGRGEALADCLAARVQREFPDARIVHRLDMATSGLIVMARGAEAERALGIAFQRREVAKTYVAVVAGRPTGDAGEIRLPLICDWPNRPRQIVDHARGKPSLTGWRLLAHDAAAGTSRIELSPHTGRSHQLRVHMQAFGHPILGDELYADPAARAAAPRLLLHATRLAFAHPRDGRPLAFASPAPF